ncbi:MAG: DUF1467 family protein [Hyphomicrobium sp.]
MRSSIAIATFLCLWFITLFTVLPFFARTQDEEGSVVPGTPASAPHKIRLWKVFAVNTLVASIAFAIVYTIVSYMSAT